MAYVKPINIPRAPEMLIRPKTFKGLMQGVSEYLLDWAYSPDCENIDVSEGILSTVSGSVKFNTNEVADLDAGYSIEKIFVFEATWKLLIIGASNVSNDHKWYYTKYTGEICEILDVATSAVSLTTHDPTATYAAMYNDSGTNYMALMYINNTPIKLSLDVSTIEYAEMAAEVPEARFSATHRERLWVAYDGAGAEKSTAYYSNSFDPEDFTTELKTGAVIVNTNDGEFITAFKEIFDDIVIFKHGSMWRVTGNTPSSYGLEKIYSMTGTHEQMSVCADGNRCYFMGSDGIVYLYDGNTCHVILKDEYKEIFGDIINSMFDTHWYMAMGLLGDKLYMFSMNDYVALLYNTKTRRTEKLAMQDFVCMTTDELVGQAFVWYSDGTDIFYLDKDALTWGGLDIDAYWFTPETDFARPDASKALTNIYLTGFGTDSAGEAGGEVKVTTYYNEAGTQKTNEKTITLQTSHKVHDIPMSVSGRLFKFKIENVDGTAFHIKPAFKWEIDKD